MAHLAARETANTAQPNRAPDTGIKILAKSLYRDLRSNGYDERQILSLSTELIDLLTSEIKEEEPAR